VSLIPQIYDGDLCERCNLHAATLIASESVMEFAHGFLRKWCECCYLDDQIQKVEKAMNSYPKLLKDLEAACRDQPPRDLQALIRENDALRTELHNTWDIAHINFCLNKPGQDWPHPEGQHCYFPKPEVLHD
jgi:hypothetical protein